MTTARLIDRARAEFMEMPGLALTLPQAARLWSLGIDDCRTVIDVLTSAGFLRWTESQTVVRTGRNLVVVCDYEPDLSVGMDQQSDRIVVIA